jgi:signal transduction histidine kinase
MMISHASPAPAPLASDDVLAILAHELRDPLGALLFALDALPRDVNPDVRRAHSIAQRQARRAVQIVDDLFDLCRALRDRLSLRKEVVQLADIVARATETTAHLLTVRGHRLTVSLTTSPMLIFADPLRLEQVLTNLLANAAKYTDPGGDIRLTADAEAGQIILRVQDNGRGIAPDLLPRVFDRFWRAPGKNMASGLGLGLALVKSLVELHGGTVAARSDGPGTGTELTVRLPDCSDDCRTIERPRSPDDAP